MGQSTIPVKQLPIVTTVDDPGDDTSIPTEQAVREAISAVSSSANVAGASSKLYAYTHFR